MVTTLYLGAPQNKGHMYIVQFSIIYLISNSYFKICYYELKEYTSYMKAILMPEMKFSSEAYFMVT